MSKDERSVLSIPFMIQFRACPILPTDPTKCIVIDFANRKITLFETSKLNQETLCESFEITETVLNEVPTFFAIDIIRQFEELAEKDLRVFDCGYRDGWHMDYSYFEQEQCRTDGRMSIYYSNSPFEHLLAWVKKHYPQIDRFPL